MVLLFMPILTTAWLFMYQWTAAFIIQSTPRKKRADISVPAVLSAINYLFLHNNSKTHNHQISYGGRQKCFQCRSVPVFIAASWLHSRCPLVMEFRKTIFQAWKVMENSKGHGKSWQMMIMSWNFYYCTEQFCKSDTTSFIKSNYELFYLFNSGTTSSWNCHY